MTYQTFSQSLKFPQTYFPPEFTNFAVPDELILPDGGSVSAPADDSVIEVLASTTQDRQYFLFNEGVNEARLFLGGDAASWLLVPRTPLRLAANSYGVMSASMAKMALFAWSIGGTKLTLGVLT